MKKIALVGCGRISNRHVDAILDTEGIEIAYVCDIDENKAKGLADKLGVKYVVDYKELNGKDLDIIAVLTPSGLHPAHVGEIARNVDIPNIICEKPISLTLREAYELFDKTDQSGKRFIPVYQNRYNPLVVFTKELIKSGKLGKVSQFVCNVLWNRNDEYFNIDWHGTKALDGGVLYTQASHYVDMMHFFFGEILESKGIGGNLRNFEVYDTVSAVCRFESDVIGTINATVNAYPRNYCTEFTLIAEKGTIRIAGTNLNEIVYWEVEDMERPDMDFKLDHQYGKGHNKLYEYIVAEDWSCFPSREDVLSGIRLMEKLSY